MPSGDQALGRHPQLLNTDSTRRSGEAESSSGTGSLMELFAVRSLHHTHRMGCPQRRRIHLRGSGFKFSRGEAGIGCPGLQKINSCDCPFTRIFQAQLDRSDKNTWTFKPQIFLKSRKKLGRSPDLDVLIGPILPNDTHQIVCSFLDQHRADIAWGDPVFWVTSGSFCPGVEHQPGQPER